MSQKTKPSYSCPYFPILIDFLNAFTATLSKKFAKWSLKVPPHLKGVATLLCEILATEEYALSCWKMNSPEAWRMAKEATVVTEAIHNSSSVGCWIDGCQTIIAKFWHAILLPSATVWRLVRRKLLAPKSLLCVARDAYTYSRSFCQFFLMLMWIHFLSLNHSATVWADSWMAVCFNQFFRTKSRCRNDP